MRNLLLVALALILQHPLSQQVLGADDQQQEGIKIADGDQARVTVSVGSTLPSATSEISIPIENKLSQSIVLAEVKSTCGCIVGIQQALSIALGGSDSLKILVTSPADQTAFSKLITTRFATQSGESFEQSIVVEGKTKRLFSTFPKVIDFTKVAETKAATKSSVLVLYSNYPELDLRDFELSFSNRLVEKWEVKESSDGMVSVELFYGDVSDLPFNEWEEFARMKGLDGRTYETPFIISLKGQYYAKPEKILLEFAGEPVTQRIILAASDRDARVEVELIQFICGRDIVEGCCIVQEQMSAKHLCVLKAEFLKFPASVLAGEVGARLAITVKGQSVPVSIPLVVTKSEKK